MSNIRVAYDGWPLIHAANSAAAIHLRTLIASLGRDIEGTLALPAQGDGLSEELGIEIITRRSNDLGKWQQKDLQKLAAKEKASLIHSTMMGASLFGRIPTLISPTASFNVDEYPSRLSAAQSEGGMQRAQIVWPADLPPLPRSFSSKPAPPIIHSAFLSSPELELPAMAPENFILVHGPIQEDELKALLEAWTWGAASIGEAYPMVIIGIPPSQAEDIESLLPQYHLEEYVQIFPELAFQDLLAFYQHSNAVFVLENSYHWGASARLAIAAGKAIVGQTTPELDHLLGDAAYLVEAGDLRRLGSAIIASIVDERIWEKHEQATKSIAAQWEMETYKSTLLEIYNELS